MRIEQTLKYKINTSELQSLEDSLSSLKANKLMDNKLMHRTLFRYRNQEKGKWVRIRMGDVTAYNEEVCVITYKKVIGTFYNKKEAVIDVRVEDYDTAIELLQEIGLERQSIQENRRSKYVCNYGDESFVVSIDEWPWLEHLRFVTVQSLSTVEHESLIEFAESLKLGKEKIHRGGVDAVYKTELGFVISEIPEVNFSVIKQLANQV